MKRLVIAGLLLLAGCDIAIGPPEPVRFLLPIDGAPGRDFYFGALPDHDPEADAIQDYWCGRKTRDWQTATDLILPSFVEMDEGVAARAAAAGNVVEAVDGHPDRNTRRDPLRADNRVVIRHDDGSVTRYRHLRNGSVAVATGQSVTAGDVLGLVGSSGDSEWPHLSFEARTPDDTPFDPWAGPCGGQESFWTDQPEYPNVFAVIDQGTTDAPATRAAIAERPPDVLDFPAGTAVTYWVHVVNRPAGLFGRRLRDPNGRAVDSSFGNALHPDPANTLYGGSLSLPATTVTGTWTIEYFTDDGNFAVLPFRVGPPLTAGIPTDQDSTSSAILSR